MIRADQIPPEVVEAAARVLCDSYHGLPSIADRLWGDFVDDARASIAAALSAWPGVKYTGPSGGGISQEPLQAPFIILPLPQEPRDE